MAHGSATDVSAPSRGGDLAAVVADAFTREAGRRLPGLREWLFEATRPEAAVDAEGLAEALRCAHTLASGAAIAGFATPAAFLRAAEIALSGAERPDRCFYELARAQRLVERAAAALAGTEPPGASERARSAAQDG